MRLRPSTGTKWATTSLLLLVQGGGAGEQAGGVAVAADAQQDQVEAGHAVRPGGHDAADGLLVLGGALGQVLAVGGHGVDVARLDRQVVQQRPLDHAVVALDVVVGHVALVAEEDTARSARAPRPGRRGWPAAGTAPRRASRPPGRRGTRPAGDRLADVRLDDASDLHQLLDVYSTMTLRSVILFLDGIDDSTQYVMRDRLGHADS